MSGPAAAGGAAAAFRKVVMSGIQPSGVPHLGNYFGALRSWVETQRTEPAETPIVTMVADLHSLTTRLRRESWEESLDKQVLQTTATLLAVGLDPQRTLLFRQSAVPEHLQLAWLSNSFVTIARLQKMGQYKAKAAEAGVSAPLGLLAYPVLMAADVLLYKATHVPVGEDQQQHFAILHHCAKNANRLLCRGRPPLFPKPEAVLSTAPRLRSLRSASAKMSKSDPDRLACVLLSDSRAEVREKLKKALTDSVSAVEFLPEERPAVANLVRLHSLVTDAQPHDLVRQAQHITTAQYKLQVADDVSDFLHPIQERYWDLVGRPDFLRQVLEDGNKRASAIARETMAQVRRLLDS